MSEYPLLELDIAKYTRNASRYIERCHAAGIGVAGVMKSFWGTTQIAAAMKAAGADQLASSRLSQIKKVKQAGVPGPYMLIRVPMVSELEEAAELADFVLMSDLSVIRLFAEICEKKGLTRSILVMADLGDLREGFWDKDELTAACLEIEHNMPSLRLAGVGVNLGCYGSVIPTAEKMKDLIRIAQQVEAGIGRRLDMVSGGATSSYGLLLSEEMPAGITHLRMGEALTVGCPDEVLQGRHLHDDLEPGHYTLKAEVLECREKPSYPQGELGIDAFGHRPVYTDRGIRKRALLGIGRADAGDCTKLIPREEGIEVVGASCDHLIIDVTDYPKEVRPGDVFSFDIKYENQLYLTNSPDVRLVFTNMPDPNRKGAAL